MKEPMHRMLPALFIVLAGFFCCPTARAEATAFTYQGQLQSGGQPANGNFDFEFSLFGNSTGDGPPAGTLTNFAVTAGNGIFATRMDFGSDIFSGTNLWLRIAVRTNGGPGPFAVLAPLQPVLPVPYALSAGNVSGPISGNGAGLTNLNWSQITGLPTTLAGYGITNALTATAVTGIVTNYAQPRTTNLNYLSSLPVSAIPAVSPGVQASEFRTPPMGYVTWYNRGTSISEYVLTNYMNIIATNGVVTAGYNYFNIDDGWAGDRDESGNIQMTLTNGSFYPQEPMSVVTNVFPHGIAFLADYAHGRGMKLGLYTTVGTETCDGFTGSAGHLQQDVSAYASWGIDYLKIETCSGPSPANVLETELFTSDLYGWAKADFEAVAAAIQSAHRPIFLNCSWNWNMEPWLASEVNSYRGCGDDLGSGEPAVVYTNELYHFDFISYYSYLTGPGHFVDPDVILNDTFGSPDQLRSIFSAYAMMSAPLWINGINASLNIVTNAGMIRIDQDSLVMPAHTVGPNPLSTNVWTSVDGQFTWPRGADHQIWVKNLELINGPKKAVLFLNRDTNAATMSINWADAGIPPNIPAVVFDCWTNAYMGSFISSYAATVAPEGCVLLIINSGGSVPAPAAAGKTFLSDLGWLGTSTCGKEGMSGMFKNESYDGVFYPGFYPIIITGPVYPNGLSTASPSTLNFYLGGLATKFHSDYGKNQVSDFSYDNYQVWGDGVKLFDSGPIGPGSTHTVDLGVAGVTNLSLVTVPNGAVGRNDLVDWGDCYVISTVTGDGGSLTNLNAANLTGAIPDSLLSPNIARLNASQTFTGVNNFERNVGIGVPNPTQSLQVNGNILASGTITGSSDRNLKENFEPVDPLFVLDQVSGLRISEWNYIADQGVRHIGPMAQDFYSAFSVGMDDRHISMVDADGVALAAIQGLNQKLDEQTARRQADEAVQIARLKAKDAEIAALKARVDALEQLVSKISQPQPPR